ncbi:MarR family transcriptional regulator [uncultured Paludibaculum sp.]|uniref:MarR family winged helix-turn-helix transcriptional regulator n=1 Tax=uncultured Paludibaculum sp. TaxID=1765020 RepID=UPI002AAA858C|nr:MarR family transcriptional regulator [uncultured Paludibaculum sp.]
MLNTTGKPLSKAEYQELADFRYQIRRFLQFSEAVAKAEGLEPQHHQAMLALKGLPHGLEPTIGAVAERLFLRHQSAVGLVDRMERSGLVKRVAAKADGRQVLVMLTSHGEALLERLSLTHREELDETAPQLAKALRAIIRRSAQGGLA